MGVQFILGNSGNGKSYYIYNKIVQESYGDIGGNYLVIVPEQFTMQTQKTLVSLHRNHSIQNIDILSFERLSYRIFDELGVKSNHVLEESGKNFLLKRVADREKGKLSVLGSNISKMGYISEMKSLISEFMQYGVKPEDIANINSMHSKSFEMKLKDVEILYRGFLDELEGTYITSEEILSLLISVAHKSKILKNATLVFDGYTGFTPVQKELLAVLMPIVKDIYVTATMDVNDRSFYDAELHEPYVTDVKAVREHDLFAMSKKMFIELFQMAKSTKVEWMDPYICTGENGRLSSSKELSFLEKHIFRRDRSVYGDAPTNIIISSLKDEKDEIKYAAETIAELVRKQGYRFKDIAVVLGNVDAYSDYIKYIFEKYDIPVFMDEKKALLKHPFIEFVRALLDMTDKSYTYDSVFRYLRSGFSGVEDSDVDILENYVRAVGIRGKKRWSEEFTYTPGDLN
nr:exodeoxyribonuclease V subunit gamma [Lachnospiraceae bacterium]